MALVLIIVAFLLAPPLALIAFEKAGEGLPKETETKNKKGYTVVYDYTHGHSI